MPVAFVLIGCAGHASAPATQTSFAAQLAPNSLAPSASAPVAAPTFAESELVKIPGVQATIDECRKLNKEYKVVTRMLESGPMKGNLTIQVACDE